MKEYYVEIFLGICWCLWLSAWYVAVHNVPEGCEPTLYYNGHTEETLYNCMSIDEGYKWIKKY